MKNIIQSDESGCWLACGAMLTNESYDDLKGKFNFNSNVTGRSANPVVQLLNSLGFECENSSTSVKNIDEDGDKCGGHWMVWHCEKKVIRDPEGWKAGTCLKIKNFRRVRAK